MTSASVPTSRSVQSVEPSVSPIEVTQGLLAENRRLGVFQVCLLGCPGSGKAAFLDRLKYELGTRKEAGRAWTYAIDPPSAETACAPAKQPQCHLFRWVRIRDTEAAGRRIAGAVQKSLRDPRSFAVYDIPEDLPAGTLEAQEDRLFDILAASDAIVVVLPASRIFAGDRTVSDLLAALHDQVAGELNDPGGADASAEEVHERGEHSPRSRRGALELALRECLALRDDRELVEGLERKRDDWFRGIDRFFAGLSNLVSTCGAMRNAGLDYRSFKGLSQNLRDLHAAKGIVAPLAYLALTDGDVLLRDTYPAVPLDPKVIAALEAESRADEADHPQEPLEQQLPRSRHQRGAVREQIDLRPEALLAAVRPEWTAILRRLFIRYKVDFLTSFAGLPNRSVLEAIAQEADPVPAPYDFRLPSYGVTAVIDWLQYARRRRLPASPMAKLSGAIMRHFEPLELRLARAGKPAIAAFCALAGFAAIGAAALGVDYWTGLQAVREFEPSLSDTEITPLGRYPAEAAYLRGDALFRTGRVQGIVRPWRSVPSEHSGFWSFLFPDKRQAEFEQILAEIGNWPDSGLLDPAVTGPVANRLVALTEQNGDLREPDAKVRSFPHYHLGIVDLRRGDWKAAARSFNEAANLIFAETKGRPDGEVRARGMLIASLYGEGVAQLQDPRIAPGIAKVTLENASRLIPERDTPLRLALGSNPGRFHIVESEIVGSPAQFNSLDIYSDLVTSYIRDFQATRDLAPASEMRKLVRRLANFRGEIPDSHPLAASLAIAGGLLGEPSSLIPGVTAQTPPEMRAPMIAAKDSVSGGGIWLDVLNLKEAFAQGRPEDVGRLLNGTIEVDGVGGADRQLLNKLAGEILGAARIEMRRKGRPEALKAWAGKVPGFDLVSILEDRSGGARNLYLRFGAVAAALALFLVWLAAFAVRSLETCNIHCTPRHRSDRLDREAQNAS